MIQLGSEQGSENMDKPVPQPRPLSVGTGFAWGCKSFYEVKADHRRWTICSVSSAVALAQFLPLEPVPLAEINNMLGA